MTNTPKLLRNFLLAGIVFCCVTNTWAASGELKLLFIGDVVLDGGPGKDIAAGRDPFAAFDTIFKQSDVRIANLECVVASTGTVTDKIFTFRADPKTLPTLKRHIDIVTLANNHSGDYGREAFAEMLSLLDQHQIQHAGGGHNLAEAHTPLIIEKNGLRIALLSYNEFMPRSFEADTDAAGIAWSEDEQVVADIIAARQHYHADLVIPFMHWGWENEPHANARQRQLAQLMIRAGADAVVGGHPHVTQDIEYFQGKPILYSLGNFMIDALDNEQQTRGWILQLTVNKQGVIRWKTQLAKISETGIPAPDLTAVTPDSAHFLSP